MVRSEPSAPRSGLDVRHLGRIAASIAVTVGLAAWVGARVDRHAIGAILSAARPGWILAAAALGPLQVALSAERWRIASARLGQPIVRERAVREVALSALLNQLLPGGLAGDALRAWRARTAAVTLGPAVRAVIVDRLVGLGVHVAVVGLGLVVWPLVHPSSPPPGAAPVALVVAAALATVPAWPRSVPWIGALAADARTVLGAPGPAVTQLALSATLTASFLIGFAACGRAIGAPLGWAGLTAIPLVLLAMAVPIGLGGWGLREATAAVILPRLGFSPEAAVALSASYGVSALLGAAPGVFARLGARA